MTCRLQGAGSSGASCVFDYSGERFTQFLLASSVVRVAPARERGLSGRDVCVNMSPGLLYQCLFRPDPTRVTGGWVRGEQHVHTGWTPSGVSTFWWSLSPGEATGLVLHVKVGGGGGHML